MARRASLPRDCAVHFNPYDTASGKGKFFLARIGRKLTGAKPLTKRFEKECEATTWILTEVAKFEDRIRRFGEVAKELSAHEYAAAVTTYRLIGECAPSTMPDLAELWKASGRPEPSSIRRFTEQLRKLGDNPLQKLTDMLDYYDQHCPSSDKQRTVVAVFEAWLEDALGRKIGLFESTKDRRRREKALAPEKRVPLSPYVRGMKSSLAKFAREFGGHLFHTIDSRKARHWLFALPAKPNTQIHYHKDLLTVWNWAVQPELGFAKLNPWLAVTPPEAEPLDIGILSPVDCLRMLTVAANNAKYLGLLPRLICCLLCGIRTQEVKKLRWDDIRLTTRQPVIRIRSEVAKTGVSRVIKLFGPTPWFVCALEWFKLVPNDIRVGKVASADWDHLIKDLRSDAGVQSFPRNCLRHSFATYHSATFDDAQLTIKILGHSAAILKKHYDAVVDPEVAEAFWAIRPGISEEHLARIQDAA